MNTTRVGRTLFAATLVGLCAANATAQNTARIDPAKARVIEHWTSERRANAIPRDLVIDPRGLGYLRGRGGVLEPYGHKVAAQVTQKSPEPTPSPFGRPSGGSGDTSPPTIDQKAPPAGATIGDSYTFTATVTDASGVASVSFGVQKSGFAAQSFSAVRDGATDDWKVSLQGFTDGDWSWWVVAKDASGKGGNTATSPTRAFKVGTGGGASTGGGDAVANAQWSSGGAVRAAAGRLYFEMPSNARRKRWVGYVCSGTVVDDSLTGRSLILTAAHCVYDDANKAFARNVMFIPNQAGGGSPTDLNCSNDPIGCWIPSFGVVDTQWTNKTFPDNVKWDYAFYVVPDGGAHRAGKIDLGEVLDAAAGSLPIGFATPKFNDDSTGIASPDFTYALGYSYSDDPNFMYCAQDMAIQGLVNWWLPSCGLSGGASGGPWVQPATAGTTAGGGPVISVNSWGYTSQPGMAGPKLDTSATAHSVFGCGKSVAFPDSVAGDGSAGVSVDGANCSPRW